ncbi:MAG: YxiJ-like protein [Blastocatellia bacterium]
MEQGDNKRASELADEIMQLYRKNRMPFPYTGCRFILHGLEDDFDGFIPDLNLWSMDIAGFASQSFRIKDWPVEKLRTGQGLMSLGFFDKHPEYRVLERFISSEETPDLYEKLKLYEKMRNKLLELLSVLLRGND